MFNIVSSHMICVKLGCFVRNALPDGICPPGLSGICPPVPKQELQVRQVQRDSVRVPLNEAEIIHANCAADEVLTGGGWSTGQGAGFSLGLEVLFSRANPADPTHEWQV
ncbi:MAG: hypothetical protein WBX01_08115 [Nitrososphaeraceae archaeon]